MTIEPQMMTKAKRQRDDSPSAPCIMAAGQRWAGQRVRTIYPKDSSDSFPRILSSREGFMNSNARKPIDTSFPALKKQKTSTR